MAKKKVNKTKTRKKKLHLNPRPFFILGFILIVAVGGYLILGSGSKEVNYFEFAECLANVGATEYGFDACPNCATQKHIIGEDAFKEHIEEKGFYVKCRPESEANEPIGERLHTISILEEHRGQLSESTTQGELCALMVAEGTPTWIINGHQVAGWQTVPELAELSGCPLPEDFAGRTIQLKDRISELN